VIKLKVGEVSEQSFNEYLKKFLTEMPKSGEHQRKNASIHTYFGFTINLLKELKSINQGSMLLKSLEHFLNVLKQTEPGSFHSGDKVSYILDANFN
jgi:hypothetical protein